MGEPLSATRPIRKIKYASRLEEWIRNELLLETSSKEIRERRLMRNSESSVFILQVCNHECYCCTSILYVPCVFFFARLAVIPYCVSGEN